jgi:hypothetical protein
MRKKIVEKDGVTTSVRSAVKETRIVMAGVLSNHAKVLVLKVPNDSTDAWGVIGTRTTGDSEIAKTEITKRGQVEASIRSPEKRTEIKNRKQVPGEMAQAEVEMSLHGSKMQMTFLPCHLYCRGIELAMEINLLTGAGAGEKRSARIKSEIEVEIEIMIEVTADGIEIDVLSVTRNGWMNQRMRRNRLIPRKTSKNGKRG